ncbi:hypothetical protein RvY_09869 [Ramazzottius varieornatus]|uniref:Uncharacterized protein n=1 Tax=Ramazzottius varieornatus TaxID=947166 RepID=A0A1D1VAV2_RAMVA|nr:hypothetical protein RvY_09869 [Ramazzottius varieornatus]
MLLNYPGVLVDAPTDKTAYLPLHFAAVEGQVAVVGSLLSRAGSQLNTPDAKGQTSLLLAAAKGHKHMAEVLLGQGADMAAKDNNGWTALHCASVTGNLEMVTLLCENGGDTVAVTNDGKIPLCYAVHAVHANHGFRGTGLIDVMEYLLQQNFSSFSLMTDQVFLMDLMHAAKNKSQKPLFVFIKYCSSPVELSLKLSRFYLDTAERDKFNAKDLIFAAKFCEQIGQRLLTISCAKYSAAEVLRAIDKDDVPLMDTLMAGSHKETVALNPVQRYLTTIWYGGVELKQWQVILTFLTVLFLPPVWLVCSLPLPHRISEIPFVKMVVHFTSHMYYIIIMILVFMTPFRPLYLRTSLLPTPEEWLLILWLIGNLMSELSTQEKRQGLDSLRIVTLFLAGVAVTVHIAAAGVDKETRVILLYIRSQLLATACFFADIQILSYLSFHQLFGPFGIMISDIVVDLARFWVLFSLFWLGFSFSLSTLYEAYIPADPAKVYDGAIIMNMVVDPFTAAQLLYWAIFGLIDPFGQIPKPELSPPFALQVILIIYGIYLTATMIVLVNLLIAMLSDTYQRVKARSDLEWRFIRARIILNMEKTPISPPPINIFSVLLSGALKLFEMCFNRRSNSVANSEELLMQKEGQQVNKLRSFRKSVIGGISAGSLPLIVSLRNAPAKQLTEVVPWKNVLRDYEAEIALGYEDFDDV